MKRAVLTAILFVTLYGVARAEGPIPDPWGWGNYVVVPAPGGGAYALGYDSGKYWQTDIDPRGNMYGYDRHGNYWTYHRQTNTYQYFATEPRWQARCYTSIADFC